MPKSKLLPLKLEHKPLHCPVCGERFMNIFGQPLPNHSQIRCETENGDQMDLAICSDCVKEGISLEMCHAILNGIKDFWVYEIESNKNIKGEEKKKKIKYHNSHQIAKLVRYIDTGKRAEKQARKMGRLE